MKLKNFALGIVFSLAALFALPGTAQAQTWYEDCRDQAPAHYSCAQEYNNISVCCRHKYDGCKTSGGSNCASLFSGCVTANATGYVACTDSITNSVTGLTMAQKDDIVIALVLRELAAIPPAKGRPVE